jgi:D-alanyl-lipoteichoic acid acyltransferase DltB (MBOAT superfamily)
MRNFDAPYLATTIREFWRRWHISLSTWLRDYLYIPLGGSRRSEGRTYVNLAVTMLLGGLWHGANWTFVVWGGLHGLYLAGERWLGVDKLDRSKMSVAEQWLRGLITFHLVCLAWIFFRCPTIGQAFEIVLRIVTLAPGEGLSQMPLVVLVLLIAVQIVKGRLDFAAGALRFPNASRWGIYASLAVLTVALAAGRSPEFIYFQF